LTTGLTRKRSTSIEAGAAQNLLDSVADFRLGLLLQDLREVLARAVEHRVGRTLRGFVGTNQIADFVQHVADVHRIQHCQEKLQVHLEAGFHVGLREAFGLLEENHAKVFEAGIAKRQAILGFVHPEAARPARARGNEHVFVDDFLVRHSLLLESLEELHEISDREIRRVALSVVAVLLAELERGDIRHGDDLTLVAESFPRALDQALVAPRESAEKHGGVRPVGARKGALDGSLEMFDRFLGAKCSRRAGRIDPWGGLRRGEFDAHGGLLCTSVGNVPPEYVPADGPCAIE
jgi:hypothetical protein